MSAFQNLAMQMQCILIYHSLGERCSFKIFCGGRGAIVTAVRMSLRCYCLILIGIDQNLDVSEILIRK